MKVLILSGSVGKNSCTRTMLCYLEDTLKEYGADTTFWDLGLKPLPIAIPEYHNRPDENPNEQVSLFAAAVRDADGIILGSPMYHGSYSGVLKNALDNLPSDAFRLKAVALVSHSSNARSCVKPCNDLRPIVRSLRGYATHAHVGTTDQDYTFTDSVISLKNRKIKLRGKKQIIELLALSTALKQMPPLLH